MKRLLPTAFGVALLASGCAFAAATAGVVPTPSPAVSTAPVSGKKQVDKVTPSQTFVELTVKQTVKLQASVSYSDGTQDGDVRWSSHDGTVVQVDPVSGEVLGVSAGSTTVFARAEADPDNRFALVNVVVKGAAN